MPVLLTLLSHWRRRPGQLAALILGLAVATALWSGVQALNAEARASYARASAALTGPDLARLVPAAGETVALSDYVALRRAGWLVSPVLEGEMRLAGRSIRVIGIEPLTAPQGVPGAGTARTPGALGGFLGPPYTIFGTQGTLDRLPERPEFGARLPTDALPEDVILVDVGLAEALLAAPGEISYLVEAKAQPPGLRPVNDVTAARLTRQPPGAEPELARLTDSYHLTLTAFGLLSFVVGLFIVHATIGLAFEQRRAMFRTLAAIGVARGRLTAVMLAELAILALVAGSLGMVLGYAIAATLLPDMAASLSGLYGAEVPGQLSLRPGWWLAGLAMTLAGTLTAAAGSLWKLHRLPVLATAQPAAWHAAQIRALRWQAAAAAGLALAAAALAAFGEGLIAGFALMGAVLLSAALALPGVLALLLARAEAGATGPLTGWFLAESRAQLSGLSLALMALLLALSVNIGVGAMVNSFRASFLGWLDQRLAADIYVRGRDADQAAEIAAWALARDEVAAVLPNQHVDITVDGWPVELYGVIDDPFYRDDWPLLSSLPDAWDSLFAGEAVMISEQFARQLGLGLGDSLPLAGDWQPRIAGIYADYGNPTGHALTSTAMLRDRWPDIALQRFALRLREEAERGPLLSDLRSEFGLGPREAVDQAGLKAVSRRIFEQTFAVTLALNVLTFTVAGLALLTTLLTLAQMRLPQLAPIWALGLTRAQLGRLELLRALGLALITALLAVPLGVLVAWILLAVINVEAFGWRIPLRHYPGQWAALTALAVATAGAAAAWPALALRRTPPAVLLRVFADAR